MLFMGEPHHEWYGKPKFDCYPLVLSSSKFLVI